LHPFVATSIGQYEHVTTIDNAIKNGLFVFGSKSQFLQLPVPHNNFKLLPQSIKDSFVITLDKGHNNPNARLTAEEWGKILFEELQLESEKTNISCPNCKFTLIVPKYKHIMADCTNCNAKVEIRNGNLLGYVSEKVVTIEKQVFVDKIVTIEKHNWIYIFVSLALGGILFFGYFYFNSKLHKSQQSDEKVQSLTALNQALEVKNTKLTSIIAKISNNQPFIIENIAFNNTNGGTTINDYSNKFVHSQVRYISPRIKIVPLFDDGESSKLVTMYVKFIEPNGSLNRNPSISPQGYTYMSEERIYSSLEYLYISGWGNDSEGTYQVGTHRVEIWCNSKLIGFGSFEVTH
jgi:hypothetical protein